MNSRVIINFFKSKTGLVLLFLGAVGIFLVMTYNETRSKEAEKKGTSDKAAGAAQKGAGDQPESTQTVVTRDVAPANKFETVAPPERLPKPAEPQPTPATPTTRAAVERKRAPLTLYVGAATPTPAPPVLPNPLLVTSDTLYAPYGRLLECRLVNTIESINTRTPVIAVVTRPLWWNGHVIVPAGTEVHGTGSPDPLRDRISAAGGWRMVIAKNRTMPNGAELQVSGLALDMDRSEVEDDAEGNVRIKYGVADGSAGLRGKVIKSDDWAEVKLFAATLISGAASGLSKTTSTAFGPLPVAGLQNAGLNAGQAVVDRYADQILKTIDRDGFYVRVQGGKRFYLYILQPLDMRAAQLQPAPSAEETQRQLVQMANASPSGAAGQNPMAAYMEMLTKIGAGTAASQNPSGAAASQQNPYGVGAASQASYGAVPGAQAPRQLSPQELQNALLQQVIQQKMGAMGANAAAREQQNATDAAATTQRTQDAIQQIQQQGGGQ